MSADETTPIGQTRKPKHKRYVMSVHYSNGPPGLRLQNRKAITLGEDVLRPPAGQRGFPNYAEPPRFLFDRKLGRKPRDLELYHAYWLVSDRTKAVLEAIDPDAFAFVRCDVTVRQGHYDGPDYWLCDVVRVLDALDEARSHLTIERRGEPGYSFTGDKQYSIAGAIDLFFREDAIGNAHTFRMAYGDAIVICDDALKDSCEAAGLQGIRYRDVSKL